MKQVIHINYQSRVIPIETEALDQLRNYTESLRKHFSNETGGDEILQDIEARIGELFSERLKSGAACITTQDMENIIGNMGRVEDFEQESTDEQNPPKEIQSESKPKRFYRSESDKVIAGVCSGISQYLNIDVVLVRVIFFILLGVIPYLVLWIATPSSANSSIGAVQKKLYRDPDHKIIAGVCSGIAKYMTIDVWIPRLIFLLPLAGAVFNWSLIWLFSENLIPGAFLAYILAWLVIPEAKTSVEKLEMKGNKIDVKSIEENIKKEISFLEQKVKSVGKETENFLKKRPPSFIVEIRLFIGSVFNFIGKAMFFLFKWTGYLVLVVFGLAILISFSILAFFTIGALPYRHWLIIGNVQEYALWLVLLFFIILPVLAIFAWFILKISGRKSVKPVWTISVIILHTIGWIALMVFVQQIARNFRIESKPIIRSLVLEDTALQTIHLRIGDKESGESDLYLDELNNLLQITDDTLHIRNIGIRVLPATDSMMKATWTVQSRGINKSEAEMLARNIEYKLAFHRDTLVLDPWVAIPKKDRFRNQQVDITIYVPVGKNLSLIPETPLTGVPITHYSALEYETTEGTMKSKTMKKETTTITYDANRLIWAWEEEKADEILKTRTFKMESSGLKMIN